MRANLLRFALLVLLALLTGAMFGLWVGFDPAALDASAYVQQQQNAIRSLNTLLPLMGAACIVLAVLLAASRRTPRVGRYLLAGTAVLLICAALVTRLGNQPINAIVMTWTPASPPPEWTRLRDLWWHWHVVRTLAAIGALVLAVLAVLSRRRPDLPQ